MLQGKIPVIKVGCIFPVVISFEFRVKQYRDDDHCEDTPQFPNAENFIFSIILFFIYRPWVSLFSKYENFFNEEGEYIVRTKYQD